MTVNTGKKNRMKLSPGDFKRAYWAAYHANKLSDLYRSNPYPSRHESLYRVWDDDDPRYEKHDIWNDLAQVLYNRFKAD